MGRNISPKHSYKISLNCFYYIQFFIMLTYKCDPSDMILLLGEGNFSFTRDFLELNKDILPARIYSTCYEDDVDSFSPAKLENVQIIQDIGVNVLFGVDSTKISDNDQLNKIKFSKIIFNFPHTGGKMKINQNRDLLKDFFNDASKLIHPTYGEICVALCKGQGGTEYDEKRKWEDTWKVIEMAGHSNLQLKNVEYFDTKDLKYYSSIGFRSREQNFNTMKGIIHVFKLCMHPNLEVDEDFINNHSRILKLGDVQCTGLHHKLYHDITSQSSIFRSFLTQFSEILKHDHNMTIDDNIFINDIYDNKAQSFNSDNIVQMTQINQLQNNFNQSPLDFHFLSSNTKFHDIVLKYVIHILDLVDQDKIVGTKLSLAKYQMYCQLKKMKDISVNSVCEEPTNHITDDGVLKNTKYKNKPNVKENAGSIFENRFEIVQHGQNKIAIKCFQNQTEELIFEPLNNENHSSIFYFHKLLQFISKNNWRRLYNSKNYLEIKNNKFEYHFSHLSPVSYTFDINFTANSTEYSHDKFYLLLWHLASDIIQRVEFLNEHQNPNELFKSYLFRIYYKSFDKPMYRKKVIDIHQNCIGKHLYKVLGVINVD